MGVWAYDADVAIDWDAGTEFESCSMLLRLLVCVLGAVVGVL
jgi:hypothetical protein